MSTITMPRLLASRPGARALLEPVASGEAEVTLDFSDLQSSAPSAIDEIVRVLIKERHATSVHVVAAPLRSVDLIKRFAKHHRALERFSFSGTRSPHVPTAER